MRVVARIARVSGRAQWHLGAAMSLQTPAPPLPSLDAMPLSTPDAIIGDVVAGFLAMRSAQRVAEAIRLGSLPAANIEAVLRRVIAASNNGLVFLGLLRAVVSANELQKQDWARRVDSAAASVMSLVYSPMCTPVLQLAVGANADAAGRRLAELAMKSETVLSLSDSAAFEAKFGERRMVHALVHDHARDELLAILYTAILPGMPASMQQIDSLSGGAPSPATGCWDVRTGLVDATQGGKESRVPGAALPATTATFYSVGSPHPATRGLRMGTRIIYSVAARIASAAPSLSTFCTLSPIPDFVAWVQQQSAAGGSLDSALSPAHGEAIRAAAQLMSWELPEAPAGVLLARLLGGVGWYALPETRQRLQPVLQDLVRSYLTGTEGSGKRGLSRCRVARFHLGNGARMFRICFGADATEVGLRRSGSLMVNYLYSDSGAEGLARTMREGAARYAAEPVSVLAMQNPMLA